MKKTHEFLKNKSRWYRDWDNYKFSYHVHWALLGIFVLGIAFGFILQLWLMPPELSEASSEPIEIELDDDRYGYECYGGESDYYIEIPASYSGSRVTIKAAGTYNPSSCSDLGVDLCNWASSCNVNVVPGQRLNFQVSWYCGYCGDYEDEDWTISVSSVADPVCGNGSCESDETCTSCASDCLASGEVCCSGTVYTGNCCSDADCSSGYKCINYTCVSAGPICGNGTCEYSSGENCSSCLQDCPCAGGACCYPGALSYTTSYGCALSGGETSSGHICCSGSDYAGDCCSDSDCGSGKKCTSHSCTASSYCGDGTCDSNESCSSCTSDCGTCPAAVEETSKPASLTFGSSGGTQDGGTLAYSEGAYTWTVNLPSNFTKVETTHYDKNSPSVVKKYMGWNGYLKVNGEYVWEFNSWSSATGALIQDYALGQEVKDSSGYGLWIDATKFFHSGSNTVTFYHFNEGDGIGTKIKLTPGTASSYCGDGACDSNETCTDCASDCLASGEVCCSGTAYAGDCCSDTDCGSGKKCTNHSCLSTGPTCGDGSCTTGENCSTCSTDCSCYDSECCAPSASGADSYGCVDTGEATISGKICCSGTDYSGDCCSDSDCSGGKTCTSHTCVSTGSICGNGTCETGETCSTCASDCLSTGQICCSGKAYTGDCCSDDDCSKHEACTSYTCIAVPYCGDGTCDSDESCESCKKDCGACLEEAVEPKPTPEEKKEEKEEEKAEEEAQEQSFKISPATQKLIDEYKILQARLIDLNQKVVVAEVSDLEVSPFDMHTSIEASVEELAQSEESEVQLISLLKHAIAAEELALATYEGEAELAGALAESSWQAFRAYLLYKIEAMVAGQLEKLDLSAAAELAGNMKENFDNSADPEEYLKEMGFADVSAINQAVHQAVNSAGGKVTVYLNNLENQVKQAYLKAYIDMFNSNFKYAIARELVHYQVAIKYWITLKGEIPKSDMPYGEYRSAMAAIQQEIKEEKDFIGGDNVFARLTSLNNTFKEGADEIDKILEEAGAAAWAVDKGASLANKETQFSDAVDVLKEYNASLQTTIDLAGESLELAGKFAESAYGTYKEAKLYSVFFNTYDKWYKNCLGGAVTYLPVPLTDKKIDITLVYDNLAPLVGAADEALVQAGQAANEVVEGAKVLADAGVEMLKDTGNKVQATVKEGVKVTHKFAVQAAAAAGEAATGTAQAVGEAVGAGAEMAYEAGQQAKEAAAGAAKVAGQKAGEWATYGQSLVYSIKWPSWGYLPERSFALLPLVQAQGTNKVELALISPSGIRFPGREYEDGSGIYVVVNNPEAGEWEAEIIGKEVKGEQPIEITTTVPEEELQKSNFEEVKLAEEKPTAEAALSFSKEYLWWLIGGGLVILIGIVVGLILFKKRTKPL